MNTSMATHALKDNRRDANATLRRLVLTGSLMAQAIKTGQQIDTGMANNWDNLLEQVRAQSLLGK